MTEAERRQRVEDVCDAALQREEGDRTAFVAGACAGDEALRQEVDALLSHAEHAEEFLAAPIGAVAADILAGHSTSLVGRHVGVYQILSLIGAGGMGEVYRARDTKLRRDVAIKVLPQVFTSDVDRLARFKREAHVLASLNHPNVAAIYGLEESDGVQALVLELVEGPTLADRIARGPIPIDEALAIAKQIAEALEAAHEQGIVHRDLKPANIKVRSDGTVKVLDFGLAKAIEPVRAAVEVSQSPTITTPAMTEAGIILGTAAYMSPEQARGKVVDKRSDIWAFGCVLFEMLSRRTVFGGETVSDTMAAILEREPPWGTLPAVPLAVDRLLHRCLEKDPKRRLRDIGDAIPELSTLGEAAHPSGTNQSSRSTSRLASVLAGVGALVAAVAIGHYFRATPALDSSAVVRSAIPIEPAEQYERSGVTNLAWSPDGQTLVFSATRHGSTQLYLRALNRLDAQAIAGTEGATGPCFSPDGAWIAFWSNRTLKKVAVAGGSPIAIAATPEPVSRIAPIGVGTTWRSADAIIYAATGEGLWQVPAAGGSPHLLIPVNREKGERNLFSPQALPGGTAVLFTVRTGSTANWEKSTLVVQSLATGERKTLAQGVADGRYVAPGYLLYLKNGTLMAVGFDADRLQTRGSPVPLIDGIMQAINAPAPSGESGAGQFSVSSTHVLAYVSGGVRPRTESSLVWVSRDGSVERLTAPTRNYIAPRLSPDGRRIAVSADWEIWVFDHVRETFTRISHGNRDIAPVWDPDGKRIVFNSDENGNLNLFWAAADGATVPERLTTLMDSDTRQDSSTWSADGRELIFTERHAPRRDLWILPFENGVPRPPKPLVQTTYQFLSPMFSPDGHWLAYASDVSGTMDVYVQAYPELGERHQVSSGGGIEPLWAHNGRELFYRQGEKVMAVDVSGTPHFSSTKARMLFAGPYHSDTTFRGYDISPDDKHFLMVRPATANEEPPAKQIIVVMNWLEELKRLVPTK